MAFDLTATVANDTAPTAGAVPAWALTPGDQRGAFDASGLAAECRRWLGEEWSILCGETGAIWHSAPEQPCADPEAQAEMCRAVSRLGAAEVIDEQDLFATVAIPLTFDGRPVVAVGTCLRRAPRVDENLDVLAEALGLPLPEARRWAAARQPLPTEALLRTARLFQAKLLADQDAADREAESEALALQISITYEEISMLHRLTNNLSLTGNVESLGRMALEGLYEVLRAQGVALQLLPTQIGEPSGGETPTRFLVEGTCPLSNEEFSLLVEHLDLGRAKQPFVANERVTRSSEWPFPQVSNLIVAPLVAGENRFGWLAAFNRDQGLEFGTGEASLLNSVATIVAIHSSNLELYRQQAELLAGVIRALTSAIDAKDPYTCGHSDRVARIAVRLGQELGLDRQTLRTIYLSGLLHDIGKIGVSDAVLRKPGKLTPAEYEHIKSHVEIGYHILVDLRQLEPMLPVVRHHHESWDGGGYPCGLKGEEIPYLARIAAVADAFDAMKSDRPYRRGMEDDRIDAIFKKGAGQQWDAQVVEAFFRARQEIGDIVGKEPADLDLVAEENWWA